MLDLASVLQGAVDGCVTVRHSAESQLRRLEKQSGFYAALVDLVCNYNSSINSRLLATFHLKTCVSRYWIGDKKEHIHEAEKNHIRNQLLRQLQQFYIAVDCQWPCDYSQFILHVCLIIVNIAKCDYPDKWEELIPCLQQGLSIPLENIYIPFGFLITLHYILKELSSRCLLKEKKQYLNLSSIMLTVTLHIWENLIKLLSSSANISGSLRRSIIISTKLLCRMLSSGFAHLHQQSDAVHILARIVDAFIWTSRNLHEKDDIDKITLVFAKGIVQIQSHQPLAMYPCLQACLEFFYSVIICNHGHDLSPDSNRSALINHSLIFVNNFITCSSYKNILRENSTFTSPAVDSIRCGVEYGVATDRLSSLINNLIIHYATISTTQFEEICGEKEIAIVPEVCEWRDNVIFEQSEKLLKSIIHHHPSVIVPIVLHHLEKLDIPTVYFSTTGARCENVDQLLAADAVIKVTGFILPKLMEFLDINSWFLSSLAPYLSSASSTMTTGPVCAFFRRRLVWFTVCLLEATKLNVEWRMQYCHLIFTVLSNNYEILSVRVTAARSLAAVAPRLNGGWCDLFPMSLTHQLFAHLINMFTAVSLSETKLDLMKVIVQVVDETIGKNFSNVSLEDQTTASHLFHRIPSLMEASRGEEHLIISVIHILKHVVIAIGPSTMMTAPVIAYLMTVVNLSSTVGSQILTPPSVSVEEACLDLLELILSQSGGSISPDLLGGFEAIGKSLLRSVIHADKCLRLAEHYFLLDGWESFQRMTIIEQFFIIVQQILSSLTDSDLRCALDLVESVIATSPRATVIRVFQQVGPVLISRLLSGSRCNDLLISGILVVVARVTLFDRDTVIAMFNDIANKGLAAAWGVMGNGFTLLSRFIDETVSQFSSVLPKSRRRFVVCMLCSFLSSSSEMSGHAGDIAALCNQVMNEEEICSPQSQPSSANTVSDAPFSWRSALTSRRRNVISNADITTIPPSMKSFLNGTFDECAVFRCDWDALKLAVGGRESHLDTPRQSNSVFL